jgi:hypothetical protein
MRLLNTVTASYLCSIPDVRWHSRPFAGAAG